MDCYCYNSPTTGVTARVSDKQPGAECVAGPGRPPPYSVSAKYRRGPLAGHMAADLTAGG